MFRLIEQLYPVPRSITGHGVRSTLAVLAGHIPLVQHEVPSGTRVFDWTVPPEWNVREAWVETPDSGRIADFAESTLHLVGYSRPTDLRLSLADLKAHVHTLPEHPDWVPYRTSYYREDWGFCLPHRLVDALPEGQYRAHIDAHLGPGSLTYGECFLPGKVDDEVLIFTHTCHPALCNDNLSGIAVATFLAREVARWPRRLSYRFVFAPATIGSITWMARNESRLGRIRHGLVVTVAGDPGRLHYKKTVMGDSEIDRAMLHVLKSSGRAHELLEFSPWGYDERQFATPGVRLPVGRLTRTPNGCYPEYHTSADNLGLVRPDALADSLETCLAVMDLLEHNRHYVSLRPMGEPQLGRRGVYQKTSADRNLGNQDLAMLWVLNQSDGGHSLLDIAERSGLGFPAVKAAADVLSATDLLAVKPEDDAGSGVGP